MKASIVPIGNSKGIRIPKAILEQCQIEKEVELEVKGDKIIIAPVASEPRKGWERAFKQMHDAKDDVLVVSDAIDLNVEDWEWL